jgi:hypothetical protein
MKISNEDRSNSHHRYESKSITYRGMNNVNLSYEE